MPSLHCINNIPGRHCPSPPCAYLQPRFQVFPTSSFAYCKQSKTGGEEGLGMRLHVSTMKTEKTFATN